MTSGRSLTLIAGVLLVALGAGGPALAADETELAACAKRVAEQILLVPADIAARPSRLRQLLDEVNRDTRLLEAEVPDEKELVSRAKAWMKGLSDYLAMTDDGTDNPLPGFPVVGLTPYVAAVEPTEQSRFTDLVSRITRIPETISNDDLNTLIAETRRDIAILKTRRSPEDGVLCRRAERWLQALLNLKAAGGNPPTAADDIGFTLDGSILDGGDVLDGTREGYSPITPEVAEVPKSPLERFLEKAREPVIKELEKVVLANPALRRKIELGPGRRLSNFRDQLLLLSDDPALLAVVDEFAYATLQRMIRNDPFGFGARLDDYKLYIEEAEFYLARLQDAERLSVQEAGVAAIATQWIAVAKDRVKQEDDGDPLKQLDGPGLVGLGRFGGFRLGGNGGVPRFVPKLADIQSFLTEENALVGLREAFDPKVENLPPVVAHLIEMVRGASLFSRGFERNLLLAQGARSEATLRDQVVALAKDEELRRLLAEIAREDFLARSVREAEKAKAGPRKVDVLIVGAGLHEQHVQNAFTQLAPKLESLALESAENVASTFDQGGYAVSLNSTLRAPNTSSLRQMLTTETMEGGDLNYLLGGVVQLNQFETRQNPVLKSMAQGIQINRYFSRGGIRLNTGIEGVEFLDRVAGNENGLYNFRTFAADGTEVWARAIIATGIGKSTIPTLPGFADAYAKSLEQYALDPSLPPRLMRPEDFYKFILRSRNPYSPFSRQTVGVAGPGDTGKAIVRWLILGSDPRAYGDDTRSVPKVGLIPWYGQTAATCDAFITSNRSFYADLGRGYRSNTIVTREKLKSVDLSLDEEGRIARLIINQDPVMRVGENIDYLVAATGYESQLGKILRPIIGNVISPVGEETFGVDAGIKPNDVIEQERFFRLVYGYEPTLGRVPIARQLINPRTGEAVPFYVVGPAAGRIVTPAELQQVDENYVANTNHNWRVWLTSQAVAAQLASQGMGSASSAEDSFEPGFDGKRKLTPTEASAIGEFTLQRNGGEENILPGDDLLFAARLFTLFEDFDLSGLESLEVRIAFRGEAGDEDRFAIQFNPGLGDGPGTEVLKRLTSNKPLRDAIISMIGRNARNKEIEVEFGLVNGTIDGSESGVSMKRRASF